MKSQLVSIRMKEVLVDKLDEKAFELGLSRSALVKMILTQSSKGKNGFVFNDVIK